MSKLLTVFGATGNQGGSVITSVLAHPVTSKMFKIRGITRDPSKPASKELEAKGVEMVKGDLMDLDSLRAALQGSYAVFAVTNYWETMSAEIEITQGKNIADISKEVGVQHLVWSTLPDVNEISGGKYPNVFHFDGKATIETYIREIGVPSTSFVPGFFYSNLKSMMKRDAASGTYTLAWPIPDDSKVPFFEAANDTGKFVAAILAKRDALLGKSILGASDFYTPKQVVETFTKVTGKKAVYNELPGDVWKSFLPEAIAQEMLENFYLIRDYKYFGGADPEGDLEKSIAILDEKPTYLEDAIKLNGPWA